MNPRDVIDRAIEAMVWAETHYRITYIGRNKSNARHCDKVDEFRASLTELRGVREKALRWDGDFFHNADDSWRSKTPPFMGLLIPTEERDEP